jgi:uncharacterized damage-inducible protein DinB
MNHYGAKEIAQSFRTVRNNTLIIAEDIPEDKYSFRPAEGTMTVGELLTHIALATSFNEQVNFIEKRTTMVGLDFMGFIGRLKADQARPRSKAEIIALLKERGEKFAGAVEGVSEDFLAESVSSPPGGTPPSRTRFDMLIGSKEHEMHHRGQLMLIERMLGITPHPRPHVRAGARYRMEEGEIEVDSIEPIGFPDITPALARESGFLGLVDLLKVAKHGRGENIYLIRFHYVPPGRARQGK